MKSLIDSIADIFRRFFRRKPRPMISLAGHPFTNGASVSATDGLRETATLKIKGVSSVVTAVNARRLSYEKRHAEEKRQEVDALLADADSAIRAAANGGHLRARYELTAERYTKAQANALCEKICELGYDCEVEYSYRDEAFSAYVLTIDWSNTDPQGRAIVGRAILLKY